MSPRALSGLFEPADKVCRVFVEDLFIVIDLGRGRRVAEDLALGALPLQTWSCEKHENIFSYPMIWVSSQLVLIAA